MSEFTGWLSIYSDLYNMLDQQKLYLFDELGDDDDPDSTMDEDFVHQEFLELAEQLDRPLRVGNTMIADMSSDFNLM